MIKQQKNNKIINGEIWFFMKFERIQCLKEIIYDILF